MVNVEQRRYDGGGGGLQQGRRHEFFDWEGGRGHRHPNPPTRKI